MKTILALLAAVSVATPAFAQYYERPPPRYDEPRYDHEYRRDHRFGRRCEAFLQTPEGPQPLICRIVRAKPLGEDCACPAPGYRGGPYVPGRTIR